MSEDWDEGENALIMGNTSRAFEIFFSIEGEQKTPNFLKCCHMALAGQLSEHELKTLERRLTKEVVRNNGQATYNLGLVLVHLKRNAEAQAVFRQAAVLGVPQALQALNKLTTSGHL
jgi:hypothetical protein